jgi:hypothetical protein
VIHQRQLIRSAIVSLLQAGGLAGGRVHDTAYKPRVHFPALVVLVAGEDQQRFTDLGDRVLQRTLHLDVIAELQQNAGLEDARDALLGEVEQLLAEAEIPGVKDIVPVAMRVDTSSEGERPIEVARQRFQITYFTPQADPASAV